MPHAPTRRALILFLATANPLSGKSFIVELSPSQSASGCGDYLLPSLVKAMAASDLVPHRSLGRGLVNVVTGSDVGGEPRVWAYHFRHGWPVARKP